MASKTKPNQTPSPRGRKPGQVVRSTYQVADLLAVAPKASFSVKVNLTPTVMKQLGIDSVELSPAAAAKAIAQAMAS